MARVATFYPRIRSRTKIKRKSLPGLLRRHHQQSGSNLCVRSECTEPRHDEVVGNRYKCTRRRAIASGSAMAISTSNHPVPLDTRKADGSTQRPPFTASASQAVTEWSLSDGGSGLHVRHDGTMILVMPGVYSSRQHLALTLPEGAVNIPARERSSHLGAPEDAALSLYWPGGIFLNVWCASSSFSSETRDKFSQWTRGTRVI